MNRRATAGIVIAAALAFVFGFWIAVSKLGDEAAAWHAEAEAYAISNLATTLELAKDRTDPQDRQLVVDRMLVDHLTNLVRHRCSYRGPEFDGKKREVLRAIEARWNSSGPNAKAAPGSAKDESNKNALSLLKEAGLPCGTRT